MIVGNGPSPPDGKATLTSIGVPSKLFVVLRGSVLPQKRTPSGCAVQATSPPNTEVISALALAGATAAQAVRTQARGYRHRRLITCLYPWTGRRCGCWSHQGGRRGRLGTLGPARRTDLETVAAPCLHASDHVCR